MKVPKTVQLRKALTLMLIILLASVAVTYVWVVNFGSGATANIADVTTRYYNPDSTATYIIGPYNSTFYYLQNHTGAGVSAYGGFEWADSSDTSVFDAAMGNLTDSGGSVFIKAGSYSGTLTVRNYTRAVIEKGAVGITVAFEASATCTLEDYENGVTKYYSAGTLVTTINHATGLVDSTYGNFTQFWSGSNNRTDAVVNPISEASYIIDVSGSYYRMKNGTTGQIDYTSVSAYSLFTSAVGNLTNGGTIYVRRGTYLNSYGGVSISNNDITLVAEANTYLINNASNPWQWFWIKANNTQIVNFKFVGYTAFNPILLGSAGGSYRNIQVESSEFTGLTQELMKFSAATFDRVIFDSNYIHDISSSTYSLYSITSGIIKNSRISNNYFLNISSSSIVKMVIASIGESVDFTANIIRNATLTAAGIYLDPYSASTEDSEVLITHNRFIYVTAPNHLILLASIKNMIISDNQILDFNSTTLYKYAVRIASWTINATYNIQISKNTFDWTVNPINVTGAIEVSATQTNPYAVRNIVIQGNVINGNYSFTNMRRGISVEANSVIHDVDLSIVGNTIYGMQYGIINTYVDRSDISHNIIRDSNYSSIWLDSSTYSKIEGNILADANRGQLIAPLSAGESGNGLTLTYSNNSQISDNIIQDSTPYQRYSIYATNSYNNSYENNRLSNGIDGIYYSNGTGNSVKYNVGFVTENSGSWSGSSPVTVAHGLAGTPTSISITVNAVQPYTYSATVDATNIVIYHNAAGSLSGWWEATYVP